MSFSPRIRLLVLAAFVTATSIEALADGQQARPPTNTPIPSKVACRWIVHEVVDRSERYLLVEGRVDKGEESDPPAEADYVVLRATTPVEAASYKLPVRTLTIPHFYTLPEGFSVKLIVQTEPSGGKVYQALPGGALVSLGVAPATVSLLGSINDQRVALASDTWLGETSPDGTISIDLWAANGKVATSTAGLATNTTLLTAADLAALRKGKTSLEKGVTLPLREPFTAETQSHVHFSLTVDSTGR